MRFPGRIRVAAGALLTTAMAGLACATPTPTPAPTATPVPTIPDVTIGGTDYSFTAPGSISGGLTRLHFLNQGAEEHHAQLFKLNDGVTSEQFQTTLQEALQAIPTEGEAAMGRLYQTGAFAGGPGAVAPGLASDATLNLSAGQYMVLCFIPSPDGVPHLAKGMVGSLAVTAPPAQQPTPPAAAGTVSLSDFAFTGLPGVTAGGVTLQVQNSGSEPHEMSVIRLKGITGEQLRAMFSGPPPAAPAGPPPFEGVGGLQAIMPGQSGWTTLNLNAGEYALICFVPSPANGGAPHAALGMVQPFTVQ